MRQVIQLRTEQLGATARTTLSARSALAWALIELQRHEEAVAQLRGLLPLVLAAWGEHHEAANGVRLHLGTAHFASGRPARAEELTRVVLAVYPVMDGLRLRAWTLLASALSCLGRHREAADEYTALLNAASPVYGEDDRQLLWVRTDRLHQLAFLAEHDLVEQESRALLAGLADDDPLRAAISGAHAFVLNSAGHHAPAETIVRAALAHHDGADLCLGLARSLNGQGRHEEALRILTDARTRCRQSGDTEHVSLLHTLTARALLGLERLDDAETQARQAVEAARTHHGPTHHRSLEAATTLASVLAARGRHTDAREHLTHCAAAWRRQFGPHHPRTIATDAELAAVPKA
ncbi:tetratricopeptide repeat protein [Kitasatospora azatica]|uniref:tetratricopeptide repeat protein n=1 Tax=Kitasatospora azatica TaxID=58347 RepID=UPI0005659686|nr:tetratricopeptide repeat protein [Kitasatospora azatica]